MSITETTLKEQEMDSPYKFIPMGSIIMGFLRMIYIMERGSTSGISFSIFWVIFMRDIKFGVGYKAKSGTREVLKEINGTGKEHVGILLDKSIRVIGKMVREMAKDLYCNLQELSL